MSERKEFVGKSVDEAIESACDYFNADRERLEIEIVEGGASGIFGLMGFKKAKVLAQLRDNRKEAEDLVQTIVERLIEPVTTQAEISIHSTGDTMNVVIDDDEHSGLIIGREGQTLSALQYMVNRIISKRWPEKVRVHLDTGNYREKQKESLRSTALFLAKKAKSTGKTQSTRPLSSYHRRLVHMSLQDDGEVNTRSKGDGPMKRVLIFPKKNRSRGPQAEEG